MKEQLSQFCVSPELVVVEALKKINITGVRTVFCVDDASRLLGVLTDSDVRRWIISGGSLDALTGEVMNPNPIYLQQRERHQSKFIIQQNKIDALPIVNEQMCIVDIDTWVDFQIPKEHEMLEMPVVIMAGGKGTRLYPYTKILPKPLIPIGEIPIVEHIINRFVEYGCKDFFLVVNHKKNMIKAYFNEIEKDYEVTFVDEEEPLGTGGGLSLLKGMIHETFILTNCDILIQEDFAKIYEFHKQHNNLITMICATQNIQIPYGIVKLGENGLIESMEEKPNINFLTNTGCYIVEPEVIDSLEADKVMGFPDIVERYRSMGENIGVYPICEEAWMDMGQMDELEKTWKKLNL